MGEIEAVLIPRTEQLGRLFADYHAKRITYDELGKAVSDLGYSTVSLYEMVRATESRP